MGKWWCHLPQKRVFAGESDSSCRDFAQLEFRMLKSASSVLGRTLDSEPRGFGWTGRTTLVEGSSCNPLSRRKSPTEEKGHVLWWTLAWSLHRQGLASDLALPVTLLESAFSQAIGAGSLTEVHIGLSRASTLKSENEQLPPSLAISTALFTTGRSTLPEGFPPIMLK